MPGLAFLYRRDVLSALHGACLVGLVFLALHSRSERQLLDRIIGNATTPHMTQEDTVVALLHAAHNVVKGSALLIPPEGSSFSLRESYFASGDSYILGSQACGSFAMMLTRLLDRADIAVRVGQMRCGSYEACHIIVTARVGQTWAALDPSYDVAFRTPSGRLATVEEVGADWDFYQRQVMKPGYDPAYRYEEVRFANWEKIPVVMPAARRALSIVGVDVNGLSLRPYFSNAYDTYLVAVLVLYAAVLVLSLHPRRHMQSATPMVGTVPV